MAYANGVSVSGAGSTMQRSGMQQVYKLTGGMTSWVGDNFPVVK